MTTLRSKKVNNTMKLIIPYQHKDLIADVKRTVFVSCIQGVKPYQSALLSVYKIHCPNLFTMTATASTKVYLVDL